MGSTPFPVSQEQSGTCMLVELGNDTAQPRRFFFDMGGGSIRNVIAMQVPIALISDFFISHLHVDHYADLPIMWAFRAFLGGIHTAQGDRASGRTPELGTKAMIQGLKDMTRWHTENFNAGPIGDGFEIEVTEFDWTERNGICYDQDGVTVRHWPRMAVCNHYESGGPVLDAESVAEIRAHWDGLFQFGGPDVQIINVTKDAIWSREASLPKNAAPASMDPRWFVPPGEILPEEIKFPTPRLPREAQQEQWVRDLEIDPDLYRPPDAKRPLTQKWPNVTLNPREMLKALGIDIDDK